MTPSTALAELSKLFIPANGELLSNLFQSVSVSCTPTDGLYFNARASPRCNLYLITAGNILNLKSFLVKYRNIKETSGAAPQGGRSGAVEGNDLPFMNSLRLPGRLENPRSCSHLSPLFLFHSSPFARVSFSPFFRTVTLSISFRSARTFRRRPIHYSDIPLIFLSCSHFLTISFYSFRSLADKLRKLLKLLVVAQQLSAVVLQSFSCYWQKPCKMFLC